MLDEAKGLITGDRNAQYGEPTQDFDRTAQFWNTYLLGIIEARTGVKVEPFMMPHDVALMVDLLKTSRLVWSPDKRDSWADKAGYVGCGWECVVAEVTDGELGKPL